MNLNFNVRHFPSKRLPPKRLPHPSMPPAIALLLVGMTGAVACHRATQVIGGRDSDTDTDGDAGMDGGDTSPRTVDLGILISEVQSKNEGMVLDEALETEDWIELINISDAAIDLSGFALADSETQAPLPSVTIAPDETVLFFADNETTQGERHLPFKLSSDGEALALKAADGQYADFVVLPKLSPNESFARLPNGRGGFRACRYATPGKSNGADCTPPPPPEMQTLSFLPFDWPAPFPPVPDGLTINELSLRPASFVELLNRGGNDIRLLEYTLTVAPHKPGLPWPEVADGIAVALPDEILAPGERIAVEIDGTHTETLEAAPLFEGVVTVFETGSGIASDRVDFMSWPKASHLARIPDRDGSFRFCTNSTGGEINTCDVLEKREIGDRLRYLRCPNDFDALAEGDSKAGIGSVKFVVDLQGGGAVHLLSGKRWPLHYTFVREIIDGDPPLDRCDPQQNTEFRIGWSRFSSENYFTVEGRRYLLGTLSHHGGPDLKCVEYTFGDVISPEQMVHGFFAASAHTDDPEAWVLRPQDDTQIEKVREVEGTVPLVGPNAPFASVTYQPLTEGIGFGYLTFLTTAELPTADLGPDKIVVLSDVPNDIPFVGGVITEAFQTPLSHVNILSRSRNTPNMALAKARQDADIAPFEGKLVKLSVFPTHFEVTEATLAEASKHWEAQRPSGPLRDIPSDLSVRGIVPLDETIGFNDRAAIGVKAAQFAELRHVSTNHVYCDNPLPLPIPQNAFAVPIARYADHFKASGAEARFARMMADPALPDDPRLKSEGLKEIRDAILIHPVDPALLTEVEEAVALRFRDKRVRFRSSSNAEDLSDFNGAGLYTSLSAELGNPERTVEDALRTVWAGLWNERAFDERTFANIDHATAMMGVLVHEAFLSEEANGVAVSRDIFDPIRGDRYYVNVQAGEASVTNPAPGVTTESFTYQWPSRTPTLKIMSHSSLIDGAVLRNTPNDTYVSQLGEIAGETRDLVCALYSVHTHFRSLLDPNLETPWFAMEIEFKQVDESRALVIKQARPYAFGDVDIPADCREF